jgi:tetratricopeptide (TPR) repeat protein
MHMDFHAAPGLCSVASMLAASAATLFVSLAFLATPPEKQSWESAETPDVRAEFLPQSAQIEVDGKVLGRGYVLLKVPDPKRALRVRVSAPGFEPEERVVEAGRVVNKQYFLALRPSGFEQKLDARDAAGMARAASALWQAGRVDDAADYAQASLGAGNTPLANRILGEVWRRRGDRDQAVRYFTMYLSLAENPPDGPEIKAWLMQDRPGDITIPNK